jgi:hypothetical protein
VYQEWLVTIDFITIIAEIESSSCAIRENDPNFDAFLNWMDAACPGVNARYEAFYQSVTPDRNTTALLWPLESHKE